MSTATKERPILLPGQPITKILAGRKTQLRDIVRPQPEYLGRKSFGDAWGWRKGSDWFANVTLEQMVARYGLPRRCPYGQPGDRLYIRETLELVDEVLRYRADGTPVDVDQIPSDAAPFVATACPSMLMPKWARRPVSLEITAVRVERIQDISEGDAAAEGAESIFISSTDMDEAMPSHDSYREGFYDLWNDRNGDGAWERNDWVFAVEFKVNLVR